ncbi:hypothetical protein GCM10027343_32930 [Noviherbaspirillum agri]
MRVFGVGLLRFQPVAEGHQLIDFGDDAALFDKRGERKNEPNKVSGTKIWLSGTIIKLRYLPCDHWTG